MKSSLNLPARQADDAGLIHLPLGDAARSGLTAALAGALQLQLARAWGAVEAVVELFAKSAASQVAVNLALPLAVTTHHNTAGYVGQVDTIIRLVHLLPALAAAAPTIATCAVFYKCS